MLDSGMVPVGPGTMFKDRYRVERLLGRGGMASVWRATDQVLDRPVAVKVLSDTIASDPEFLARFRREAKVAAGLWHPNLIGVYDYADAAERPYLVLEYVPGVNLAERMAAGAGIDCERLARELLGALAHIHGAGIVHRDIKPQNILIAADGSAKLIDFGIALPADATALTRTGQLIGTARYLAPEVMSGGPATERSDLYSCGVLLDGCLDEAPSPRLRALVERLSAAEPGRRPASAERALAEIDRRPAVLDEPTERLQSLPPPASPSASGGGPHRGRLVAVLGGIAALVAALVLVLSGEDDGGSGSKPVAAGQKQKAQANVGAAAGPRAEKNASGGEAEVAASESEETEETSSPPSEASEDPATGAALNQEGFALIQEGRPEEAVPVLEEAVASFPTGSEELDYAYALFNLGNALRLSGRPEEAIPVLEQRLEYPNQTATVRDELAAAESEAGR